MNFCKPCWQPSGDPKNSRGPRGFRLAAVAATLSLAQAVSAGNFSGRITSGGRGVPGVTVTANGFGVLFPPRFAVTDAGGFFTLLDSSGAGDYTITPSKPGVTFSPASRSGTVSLFQNVTGLDFNVASGPVRGQVASGTYNVPGATVTQSGGRLVSFHGTPIPDANTTGITVQNPVPLRGTLRDVAVGILINHTYIGDLEVTLIHPDGTERRLHNLSGGGLDNIGYAFYSSSGGGGLVPVDDLRTLNGKSVEGTWQLRVRDLFGADTGQVVWFDLVIQSDTVTDVNGGFDLGSFRLWDIPGNFYPPTITVARPGFTFSPASQVASPGVDVNFGVAAAPILGRVTTRTDGGQIIGAGTVRMELSRPGSTVTVATDANGFYDSGALASSVAWTVRPTAYQPGSAFQANVNSTPASSSVFIGQNNVDFFINASAPAISPIANRTVAEDSPPQTVAFSVYDLQTPLNNLIVTATSSDPTIIGPPVMGGSGGQRTLTFTPQPNAHGVVTITVSAQDAGVGVGTVTFLVTITPVNDQPVAGPLTGVRLDGSDEYVLTPSVGAGMSGNPAHTLEMWVRPDPIHPGLFASDFSAGTPSGMSLYHAATVSGGYLRLTPAVGGQNGIAFINNFGGAAAVDRFRASFKLAIFGGTATPADGFSFNLVPVAAVATPPPVGSITEDGLPHGLSVNFDTFEPGAQPVIEVTWLGNLVARAPYPGSSGFSVTDPAVAAKDILINLDPDGTIDVSYDGQRLINNVPTGYNPAIIGTPRWILAARTGGFNDNHWIDNLRIEAPATSPNPNARVMIVTLGNVPPAQNGAHYWLLNPGPDSTNSLLECGIANTRILVSGLPIPADTWTHIAATWTPGTATYTVFLNGVQAGQLTGGAGFNLGGVPLTLGQGFSGVASFRGSLDEVRLWSTALLSESIRANMDYPLKGSEAGLQVYHRFDETDSTVATDSAAFRGNNDGTLIGGATHGIPATVPVAGSLRLDGVDDYAEVPARPNLALSSQMTVEAWVNPSSLKCGTLFSRGNGADLALTDFMLTLGWDGANCAVANKLAFQVAGVWHVSVASLPLHAWSHVAATYDGANVRLYINGVLDRTLPRTGPIFQSGAPLQIGRQGSACVCNYFGGLLDDVRLWNTVRSAAEILDGTTNALTGNEPGLLAFYRFDEGSGPVVADGAGGDNFGTIAGNPVWAEPARGVTNAPTGFGIATVNEDVATTVFLPAFDAEHHLNKSNLTFTVVTQPAHGSVAPASGTWSNAAQNPILFTPTPDYTGPDAFTYRITDAHGLLSGLYTVPVLVQALNDPPTIGIIRDLVIEENTASPPITFTVADADTPLANLIITVESQDNTIISPSDVVITGTGGLRTMIIRPVTNEVGTATLVIRVSDRIVPADPPAVFKVRVVPKPAYAILNLGTLAGYSQSFGGGVNNLGWVAGMAQLPPSDAHAFLFKGIEGPAGLTDLATLGGQNAEGNGLNDLNFVTGVSTLANGQRQAFRWSNGTMTGLGFFAGGTSSEGRAINNEGKIAGVATTSGGARNAFLFGGALTNLGTLIGGTSSEAFAINDASEVVGYSTVAGGADRAFLYRNGVMTNLGTLPSESASRAHSINNTRQIAGYSQANNNTRTAVVFDGNGGPIQVVGKLPGGAFSVANGINDFGQVVGQAGNSNNANSAFFYSANRLHDLNDIISREDSDRWRLQEARAINRDGFIVGTGILTGAGGGTRAFLAVPAWVIGRPIARPEGAVKLRPEIEVLSGPGTPDNSFFWSTVESRLYAIRPVTARLRWFVEEPSPGAPLNTNRLVTVGIAVWPRDPSLHVANTPTDIEPRNVGFQYSFQQVIYQPQDGVEVEPSTKRFTATRPGYTVLHYIQNNGSTPRPDTHPPAFDVVRTVEWNDPAYLTESDWAVGDFLHHPAHFDYGGRNGYVYFPKTFIDSTGPDRAYDRDSRLGPIIPVNAPTDRTSAENSPLVVVWYQLNGLGVAWSSTPVRYALNWPASAPRLVIASTLGSGPMDPVLFPDGRIYNQPVRSLPGYNPNEEHALIRSSGGGQVLYALRDDLNWEDTGRTRAKVSMPFALFKHRDPGSGEWRVRAFQVVAEGIAYDGVNYTFTYPGLAGQELTPPFPLSSLTVCAPSHGVPGAGPWWEDINGKIYARAAGPEGGNTNILIQWHYPLQPGFSYDNAFDGTNDVADGTCLAWLDRSRSLTADGSPGTPGTAINVTYHTRWPDDAKVLQFGETLLDSRRGLPDVLQMAAVKIIYDDLNPTNGQPLSSLARFYDPVSPRTVALPAGFLWPDSIARENISGKEYFPGLPYSLKQRLYHDPINKRLTFEGVLKLNFSVGQNPHLLLPNVISPRERDRILALAPGASAWVQLVTNLFNLTRNPNGVDLDGVGGADLDLRLGLTTINGVVVPEQFGDGPKALTAALGGVPPPPARPGSALKFDTQTSSVDLGLGVSLGGTFTEEAWIYPQATTATNYYGILGNDPGAAAGRAPSLWIHDLTRVAYGFGDGAAFHEGETAPVLQPGAWNHLAATFDGAAYRIYVNGILVKTDTTFAGRTPAATPVRYLGERLGRNASFPGQMDEVRLWRFARTGTEIGTGMRKRLNGGESGLAGLWRCDEGSGTQAADAGPLASHGTLSGVSWVNLASQNPVPNWGLPPRFITLAENDAEGLPGLPITLRVIRVDDGPYPGDLKTLPSDNVFDERVSMRHSSDFGGAPERLGFQWYYKPDEADFDATDLPGVNPATGNLIPGQERGWTLFPVTGTGVNDITLGEGGESSLVTLGDNWFICRYQGYNVNGNTNWSNWIGAEEGRAQLVEGWIKRVIRGLNQFDARTDDFHSAPANTFASMLIQAGERFEGPIAFNPDAGNLNSLGLIEAYTTVFERGRDLSIQGSPPVNFDAANNALLLVASRIADLYTLLGNESYSDAQDPTIGFGTASGEYGSVASSIFTFQNQLDSLLDEELALLRGLDNRGRSVRLPPTYNRLVWNFTLGDGEVAYRQAYNIGDQNFDGFINEQDARILYPQGHGDAWGHYLTAIKSYYFLMRHPNFTWKPRTENVLVAGAPVPVDFLDERKFARIAAAKAKAGRDIVDLTYRQNYVEDPAGQWQGYKDTDANRAWGVDDWARRANQGAYLDWLAANAILPATDPNTNHTGIQKIDRQTVSELGEIAAQALEVQTKLDQADVGLNPVGIAKGSVPFDIDPTFLEVGSTAQIGRRAVQGLTQFDQILERAVKAVKNSMAVWDEANQATELLRRTQDSVDDFAKNVREQEFDYKNRLIEIFGYPYAGDIGAGKTYRSGYDGPDLIHHAYISSRTATGDTAPPSTNYTGYFRGNATNGYVFSPTDEDYDPYTTETAPVTVDFPLSSGGWAFDAPASWGERRAPGELQLALSDLVQAENNLKLALQNYDGIIYDIIAQVKVLEAQRGLNATRITVLNRQKNSTKTFNELILAAQRGEIAMRRISSVVTRVADALVNGIPDKADIVTSIANPVRGAILGVSIGVSEGLETVADVLQVQQTIQEQAKEDNDLQIGIDLQTAEQDFELLQSIEELNHTVRDEISLRLELYNQAEVVQQTLGRYLAKLSEGQRLIDELERFRKATAAQVTEHRYEDMTFRIFRNDALQKYRASFDIAARYVYLAANAYDYDINFLRTDQRAGSRFLTEIVRQRNLGQLLDGEPVVGQPGLCDLLGRMTANWEVLKPQFGVSAPQIADTRFSLREELFRIRGDTSNETANASWREVLTQARVANLWDVPEFRRYCRPFAPELLGPQPAIVIRFPTTITFGLNYFGWPLAGGDSAYDPTQFSTKIARAGVWFSGSDGTQVSQTPRIYFVPVGMDVQRSPTGDTLATREWRIIDQAVPPPFPIGASDLNQPGWIPMNDTLGGTFAQIRHYGSFGAKHDQGIYSEDDLTNDTRLIGRSAWNTEWLLIIPGGTLLFDPDEGLETFINTVTDIKIYFQTYSYAGN